MYSVEEATLEEFLKVCEGSIEETSSLKECYDGYEFDKLTYNDEPIVVIGWHPIMDLRTNQEELYMACAISVEAIKHKRALCLFGKDYLDFMTKQAPLCAICEKDNKIFSKFAEHFGFERINFVEKNEESGIIYNVYIRRQK